MTVTVFEVDGVKFAGLVGMNTAVIECVPAGRAVSGATATPPISGMGVPRVVVASSNCTVPAALNGVTVAVGST